MQKQLLLLIIMLPLAYMSIAKPIKEIQIGLSYNTLQWKITNPIFQPPTNYKYAKFNINPNIRYSNTFCFSKPNHLHLTTFIGYSTYGGKSKSDTTKFKEIYSNHCIIIGLFPNYQIIKKTSIGIGIKLNYALLNLYKYYGTIYQSDTLPRKWFRENVSDRYKKLSTNIGFNIKHNYQRFSFSFEAWFGLSNLDKIKSAIYKSTINENNYNLILGYSISKGK